MLFRSVLDFSNRSFQEFISTSTGLDIYSPKYDNGSGSKANRLRAFWEKEPDTVVGKLLQELFEYWRTIKIINGQEIKKSEKELCDDCVKIANKLLGRMSSQGEQQITEEEFLSKEFKQISLDRLGCDSSVISVLNQRLDEINRCLSAKSSLAVIFLCGSVLEGILLSIAIKKPKIGRAHV